MIIDHCNSTSGQQNLYQFSIAISKFFLLSSAFNFNNKDVRNTFTSTTILNLYRWLRDMLEVASQFLNNILPGGIQRIEIIG